MKDVPHHMAKFMRKLSKPTAGQTPGDEELKNETAKEKPLSQIKKQKKARVRKQKGQAVPLQELPEERNKDMKKRTPRIRERSHKKI